MTTGVKVTPQNGRDRVLRIGMMVVRTGFLLAVVLGVGMMFGLFAKSDVVMLHMGAGALVLLGALVALVRVLLLGQKGLLLGLGVLLGMGGAAVALGGLASGPVHLVLMLATVALSEINVAKASRR